MLVGTLLWPYKGVRAARNVNTIQARKTEAVCVQGNLDALSTLHIGRDRISVSPTRRGINMRVCLFLRFHMFAKFIQWFFLLYLTMILTRLVWHWRPRDIISSYWDRGFDYSRQGQIHLDINRCFRGKFCLHVQGWKFRQRVSTKRWYLRARQRLTAQDNNTAVRTPNFI